MPNWSKVAGTRAANAVKALELLPNTAGKGYEFTPEEAADMFATIDEALALAKEAYAPRMGGVTSEPANAGVTIPNDPELIMHASRIAETESSVTANTTSSQPLVVPHWAQIKEFVAELPEKQLASYIMHLSDRIYEDAVERHDN